MIRSETIIHPTNHIPLSPLCHIYNLFLNPRDFPPEPDINKEVQSAFSVKSITVWILVSDTAKLTNPFFN